MVYTFVITMVGLHLNSIFNLLNAIMTKYRFLANKNTKLWKLIKENMKRLQLLCTKQDCFVFKVYHS